MEIFLKLHLEWVVYVGLEYCGYLTLTASLEQLKETCFHTFIQSPVGWCAFEDYPSGALF